nr:hypothetical protein [Muricauda sp. UBA7809]|tara:strand:- start:10594 stop:10782 length:189 start_codon:yes stop_codon:yes gene_type:complete
MIITGTKSNIIVETEGKSLKIEGELTTTPAFYADKDSIKNWESPYDKYPNIRGRENGPNRKN